MIKFLLVLLVLLVVGDGVLTRLLIDGGLATEGNPFLVPIVGENGFIALKIVGALICAFILWDVSRRYPRLAMAVTSCCVIAYWGIVLWNASILIQG